MELFIEFVLTIVLSLLFSFILTKLFSTSDHQNNDCLLRSFKDVNEKGVTNETKFEAKSKNYGFERETKLGFVAKVVDVDKKGESTKENLNLQEFMNEGYGSSKVFDEVNKGSKEVEIVNSECEEKLVHGSSNRSFNKIEIDLVKDEVGVANSEEIEVLKWEDENNGKEGFFDEDDDWEGIEKSELDKVFGSAVVFVGSKCNADKIASLGSDLKMQLYALHKVATEGTCHESQPMALKVSARAKWNAWQRLGNMSPEEAMEQYINLLLRSIPGWMQDDFGVQGDREQVFANAQASRKLASECKTLLSNQPGAVDERNLDELKLCVEGLDVTGSQVHF